MKLSELRPPRGAKKNRKRVGRGPGSGHGKTATHGHKGQLARSGGRSKPYGEGGQMPIYRRVPKRGFKSLDKKVYQIVNLADLSRLKKTDGVGPETLLEAGLLARADVPVKILGDGEAPANLVIKAHAFSRSAKEKIEARGGKAEVLNA
jgi:large subunit ribosomal protein L15